MRGYYEVRFHCPRCGARSRTVWHPRRRPKLDTRCVCCWRLYGRAVSLVIDKIAFRRGAVPEFESGVFDQITEVCREAEEACCE